MLGSLPSTGNKQNQQEPTVNWDETIEKIADRIVNLGLETPAIIFLEMNRPLTFFANQFLIFMAPFLFPILGDRVDRAPKFFEERENLDKLIRRIEEKSKEKIAREKELKKKKRMR